MIKQCNDETERFSFIGVLVGSKHRKCRIDVFSHVS